jgi:hypothetical protein
MSGNGQSDIPLFFRNPVIEGIARSFGYKTQTRVLVRFPARFVAELEAWIQREKKSGHLTIHYTEGTQSVVSWEETR